MSCLGLCMRYDVWHLWITPLLLLRGDWAADCMQELVRAKFLDRKLEEDFKDLCKVCCSMNTEVRWLYRLFGIPKSLLNAFIT